MENKKLQYGNYFTDKLFNSNTDIEREQLCKEFEQVSSQKQKEATKPLIEFLKDDRDTREHNAMRSWVPIMLGYINTREAYKVLIEQLYKEKNDVVLKWIVIVLINDFNEDERFEHIYKKYQEEKDRIIFARQIIVDAISNYVMIGKTVGPYGIQILKEAISDIYTEVRTPAINALGKVQERSAVPALLKLLASSYNDSKSKEVTISPSERRAVVETLAKIGNISALQTVITIAENEEEELNVRIAAVNTLGSLSQNLTNDEKKKKIIETLNKLICDPIHLISHTATAAIRSFLSDERAAIELARYGLVVNESDIEQLANAIRMVDTNTAIEFLDEVEGESEDRAKRLIAETGGEYAIQILNDRKYMKITQYVVDGLAFILFVVGIALVIAWFFNAQWIQDLTVPGVVFIVNVFWASVLVAFPARTVIRPLRYLFSILLAFIFTVSMLAVLTIGLSELNNSEEIKPLRSFGPITVFPYSSNTIDQNEWQWALSLSAGHNEQNNSSDNEVGEATPITPSTESITSSAPTNGFWAPVWVLFLATLGAGLLTVSLIVKEISDRPRFSDQTEMRERLGKILQHQFFILFAPIGGIFVFQALISIGAASKTMTVALAALGAGASLNFLLERAVRASKQTFYSDSEVQKKSDS